MDATARLTPAQRKFLASYLPDLLHGENCNLAQTTRAEFARRVAGMDFDDGDAASAGAQHIARNLRELGFLSDLDIHPDVAGGGHIYLCFSTAGAHALFDICAKGA